jgi:Ca-activated chloride channel family protein
MVTDGIDLFKTEDRLQQINQQGIIIHVMAVGTAEGAPIPTNQGFLKDLRGQIVIPHVDFNQLQQAAQIGQGKFSVLSNSMSEDQLYETDPNNDFNHNKEDELGTANFIDDGPLLAWLIIPMLALLYRRGILMVLCMGFMLNSEISHALTWNDFWLNPDQQAYKLLESAPTEAYNQAKDLQIKAAAAYKKQDFKTATQLYPESGQNLADLYNRGNALAQAGEFAAALSSYEQALTYEPTDEDTLYNKKIVEDALKQQQEQEQQNKESQENQEKQENQDSQQSDQEQQSQENQESSEQEKNEQEQLAQKDQQTQADEEQRQEEQSEEQQAEQQESEQEVELTPEEKALDAEEKQAMEQWLRRIKDDPGGLMRRKFLYQYHKRNQNGESYDQQTTEDW